MAQVLDASEDVLRRYGPGQATVVDVARELGISHGSVYGHFPSRPALRLGRGVAFPAGPGREVGITRLARRAARA